MNSVFLSRIHAVCTIFLFTSGVKWPILLPDRLSISIFGVRKEFEDESNRIYPSLHR